MHRFGLRTTVFLYALALIAFPRRVSALDTTETYDLGATDFEFYLGYDGLGKAFFEREIAASALAGFGLIEALSGYLAVEGASNEDSPLGTAELAIGLFGTPLDTDHLDVDLVLNVGAGADHFEMTPGLEINCDLRNDLLLAGLYLRFEETLAGREESFEDEPRYVLELQSGLVVGAYWTVVPDQQILLEYEMGLLHNPAAGERRLKVGRVALGYNLMLADSLELLSELSVDIPQKDEKAAVGITLGLIATMPSAE